MATVASITPNISGISHFSLSPHKKKHTNAKKQTKRTKRTALKEKKKINLYTLLGV